MGLSDKIKDAVDDSADQADDKVAAAPQASTATSQKSAGGEVSKGMTDLKARMDRVKAEAEKKAKRERAVKADKAAQIEKARADKARQVTHKVKSGDTLSAIGARYGVPWTEIAEANKIANPDLIFPGQVFVIPEKK